MVDQDAVTSIYDCYRRAMAGVGRRTQLPPHTDASKTYAYRAIRKFLRQTQTWKLDNNETRALVKEVVQYGKRNGLLNKGTALLNMRSVLDICFNYLRGEITKTELLITDVERSKKFIDKQVGRGDLTTTLLHKENRRGYTNLTQWYRSGDLALGFVTISTGCRRALNLLPLDERREFPADLILLRGRIKILQNLTVRDEIKKILKNDLLVAGTPAEHMR
jgi:hypothetical protein